MTIDFIIYGILTLIPPILITILVLITKNIKKSFFFGILSMILILPITLSVASMDEGLEVSFESFSGSVYFDNLYFSIKRTLTEVFNLFFEEKGMLGFINGWNVSIIFFLFALGIMTSFMVLSGGTKALTEYLNKKITTRKRALFLTAILGIIVFIDDYFNSLVVGSVAKPLTEKHKISRAKLAYIVDSTSAPICVVMIVSSWGAGIVGALGSAISTNDTLSSYNAIVVFLSAIPYQFYVFTALAMVFITIVFNINIGPMKQIEEGIILRGVDESLVEEEIDESSSLVSGHKRSMLIPLALLVIATIGTMLISGFVKCGSITFIGVLENIDVALSLRVGGATAIISSFVFLIPLIKEKMISKSDVISSMKSGFKSMVGANIILLAAWLVASLISIIGTRYFLAELIVVSHFPVELLPVVLFLLAAFMAFSTGTSWGTFGILIPIASSIISAIRPDMFVIIVASTLSGAIFGDHASPISDTTLLSSAGSGCIHTKHFSTQLPYALTSAGIAIFGYLVMGVLGFFSSLVWLNLVIAYAAMTISFVMFVFIYKKLNKGEKDSI